MTDMNTTARIQNSWDVRRSLIDGILQRGETLVESLKLVPEMRESLKFERWKQIVAGELAAATERYGNGEPLLSEPELTTLASIMNPTRGW